MWKEFEDTQKLAVDTLAIGHQTNKITTNPNQMANPMCGVMRYLCTFDATRMLVPVCFILIWIMIIRFP